MKCDEKEPIVAREKPFEPESQNVVVCEGFQDAGFICALLKHLKIADCDVAFPKKKRDGKNGKDGISDMVKLLCQRDLKGIFVVRDADGDPQTAFQDATAGFDGDFAAPKAPFVVDRGKRRTGVFLLPGKDKNGALEHLLIEAVAAAHPPVMACVDAFQNCSTRTSGWESNKIAKMKMHCVVASFCKDDPGCSLGFIWYKGKDNPLDISSESFREFSEFLKAITAD